MNPALPGTILALVATILLVLATISVPVTTRFYLLSATANNSSFQLGVLGFCLNNACSSPSVGYRLTGAADLLGIGTNIPYASQLSSGALHGLTYTLVLHPVAAGMAACSVIFGIFAFCAVGLGCLATFAAGLAVTISLVAFAIDMALFTILKRRIEAEGGTAEYGNAIWLTLAAFVVLIVAQLAYCCSCCGSRGRGGFGSGRKNKKANDDYATPHPDNEYGERMRMDALAAEQARKNGTTAGQNQLPKFAEYEHEVPLKHDYNDGAYDDSTATGYNPYRGGAAAAGAGAAGVGSGINSAQGYYNSGPGHTYGNGGSHGDYDYPYQQQNDAGYAPGVGPTYGAGAGMAAGGAAAAAAAYASRGAGHSESDYHNAGGYAPSQQGDGYGGGDVQWADGGGHGSQQPSDNYYDYHDAAGTTGQAYGSDTQHYDEQSAHDGGGGGSYAGRQPSIRGYDPVVGGVRAARSRQASQDAHSISSGYGQGGPASVSTPQPVPAIPQNYLANNGDTSSSAARQDDGFGLSALQAGAAAASRAPAAPRRQETSDSSGMYYDAQPSTSYYDAPSTQQQQQQQPSTGYRNEKAAPLDTVSPTSESAPSVWQHSNTHGVDGSGATAIDAGAGDVPSYEQAMGSSSSPMPFSNSDGASRTRGRPLPVPGASGSQTDPNGYPREKY